MNMDFPLKKCLLECAPRHVHTLTLRGNFVCSLSIIPAHGSSHYHSSGLKRLSFSSCSQQGQCSACHVVRAELTRPIVSG